MGSKEEAKAAKAGVVGAQVHRRRLARQETEALPPATEALPQETEARPQETEARPQETEARRQETGALPRDSQAQKLQSLQPAEARRSTW